MTNATGTMIRITGLISLLLLAWFGLIGIAYLLIGYIVGLKYSLSIHIVLFLVVLGIKAFYPKNVFR